MKKAKLQMLVAACGSALGLAGAADAQTVINISGATLFENFFKAGASTIDYFDVDADGRYKNHAPPQSDQLANFTLPGTSLTTDETDPSGCYWSVQYFVNGSVKGLFDLANYGYPKPYVTDNSETGPFMNINDLRKGYYNRGQYFGTGAGQTGVRNNANPYGAPVRSSMDGLYVAQYSAPGTPSAGGIRIDIAPVDVPSFWGIQFFGGSADFAKKPGQPGYGQNARRSVNKQGGTSGADQDQKMVDLSAAGRTLFDSNNPPPQNDQNTIFDTPVAAVPIAIYTGMGSGYRQLLQSELRHLQATGRLPSGDNLMVITREAGSGTRNGVCNSLCLDPSWGVGENVGANNNNNSGTQLAGPNFLPSNKIGSGDMESTLFNCRLAIGYSGAERYVNNGLRNNIELIAVKPDLANGSAGVGDYARPTADRLLHNSPLRGDGTSGYVIFGVEQFATIGDPQAAPVAKGGVGPNGHPAMDNVEAAAYINNITRSIIGFSTSPDTNQNTSTAGEYMGVNFILVSAIDRLHTLTDPCTLISNPALVSSVQTYALNNSVYAINSTIYGTYGQGTNILNGRTPTRTTGQTYSDGVSGATANYVTQAGNPVNYASTINDRNRIVGDFSGDAVRDSGDINDMIAALKQRQGGPAWVPSAGSPALNNAPGSTASIELLGDFNSDGNFNVADVRYFCDGLAMRSGLIDRRFAFTQADTAFGGNLFGTTLATGKPYASGDSRGDVAGAAGVTPGFAPVGFNGVVNGADIDYVFKQFRQNPRVTDGVLNWDNTFEAVGADYSANMTSGDNRIDINDACDIVRSVLGTDFGDANLDRQVTCADLGVINQGAMPYPGGWAQGDVNGDGVVNADDVKIIKSKLLPGDINGDGCVNTADLTLLLGKFGQTVACDDLVDLTGSGTINTGTLTILLGRFGTCFTCP